MDQTVATSQSATCEDIVTVPNSPTTETLYNSREVEADTEDMENICCLRSYI